ncbi:hypothetical protein ACN2C6_16905 [Caulobacter sp. ErkDOM-YI]|uniref:hypothetical protein n=1 Tax=unclassified Caulobacter TaxID=2648921 RepID=UPI003AF4EE7F
MMTTVYILAHFDDEYAALPLLLRDCREGAQPWLLYVADYASPALSARRLAETRALLASLGLPPEQAIHVGAGTGVLDGAVFESLPAAHAAVQAALTPIGPVDRFVVAAWEGGHADHDACAFMTVTLRDALDPAIPIDQFGLYNGRRLVGGLFRACAPIPENGQVQRLSLSPREWIAFAAAVRFFPSQAKTWLALWPSMFLTFLVRGGFGYQTLAAGRVRERPHAGPLLYERLFKTPYRSVRARLDTFNDA